MTCNDTLTFKFQNRDIKVVCVGPEGHEGDHYSVSGSEWPNPPKHKSSGGYGPHDWDCPACKAESERRAEYRKNNNPHRPGTKAAAKWASDRSRVDWAMDMRGETYWSM